MAVATLCFLCISFLPFRTFCVLFQFTSSKCIHGSMQFFLLDANISATYCYIHLQANKCLLNLLLAQLRNAIETWMSERERDRSIKRQWQRRQLWHWLSLIAMTTASALVMAVVVVKKRKWCKSDGINNALSQSKLNQPENRSHIWVLCTLFELHTHIFYTLYLVHWTIPCLLSIKIYTWPKYIFRLWKTIFVRHQKISLLTLETIN